MYKTQFSVSWPGHGDPRFPLFMSFLKTCGRMFQVETLWSSPRKAIDDITSLQQNSQLDLETFKVIWICCGGDPVIYVSLAAPKSEHLKCSFNVDLWDRNISWDLEGIIGLIEPTNPFEASIWHPENADALKSRITCAFSRESVEKTKRLRNLGIQIVLKRSDTSVCPKFTEPIGKVFKKLFSCVATRRQLCLNKTE